MSAAQTAQTCQIVRNKSILRHLTTQKTRNLISLEQNQIFLGTERLSSLMNIKQNEKSTFIYQKLVSPSQNSSNFPVTLRGPEHCLTESRSHASQAVADKNVITWCFITL